MMDLQGTTAQEKHLFATVEREAFRSPPGDKHPQSGGSIKRSPLDILLEADKKFFWMVSRYLADIVARLKVPEFLIEDLVQEAWMSAFQHRDQFDGFAEEELKRRLPGLLRKVVHDKAVDLLRHLDCSPCRSLDAEEIEPIDDTEPTRVKTAERRAQLATLLARLQQEEPGDHWLLCEHRLERRKLRELAEEKGWTEHKVRCRLYRAMEKLRAWASFAPSMKALPDSRR